MIRQGNSTAFLTFNHRHAYFKTGASFHFPGPNRRPKLRSFSIGPQSDFPNIQSGGEIHVRHKYVPVIGGLIVGGAVAQLIYQLPLDYPTSQVLVLTFAGVALSAAAAKRVAQRLKTGRGKRAEPLFAERPAFTPLRFGDSDRG
jgi:hypothetical protein